MKLKHVIIIGLIVVLAVSVGTGITFAATNGKADRTFGEFWGIRAGKHIDMQDLVAKSIGISKDDLIKACQSGKTLNDILKEKNISLDTFKKNLIAKVEEALGQLVKDEKLTQDQANTMKSKIESMVKNITGNEKWPAIKGFKDDWGLKAGGLVDIRELTAKVLSITEDELIKKYQSGKTLNDILKEKNISLDTFKQKLSKEAESAVDKLVKEGKITQDQANIMKQRINNMIQNLNGDMPGICKGFKNGKMGKGFKKGPRGEDIQSSSKGSFKGVGMAY